MTLDGSLTVDASISLSVWYRSNRVIDTRLCDTTCICTPFDDVAPLHVHYKHDSLPSSPQDLAQGKPSLSNEVGVLVGGWWRWQGHSRPLIRLFATDNLKSNSVTLDCVATL